MEVGTCDRDRVGSRGRGIGANRSCAGLVVASACGCHAPPVSAPVRYPAVQAEFAPPGATVLPVTRVVALLSVAMRSSNGVIVVQGRSAPPARLRRRTFGPMAKRLGPPPCPRDRLREAAPLCRGHRPRNSFRYGIHFASTTLALLARGRKAHESFGLVGVPGGLGCETARSPWA